MGRRFHAVNRGGKRRQTDWVASADQGFLAVAAGAKLIQQSLPISAAGLSGATVVRSRGASSFTPQVLSGDVDIVGAWGMGIVSNEAFAAGAASIPGPWTNADWDGWFVWEPISYLFEVTDDVGRLLVGVQVPFDSKAMRKVDGGETMVVMVESQASAMEASINFRLLFKLP